MRALLGAIVLLLPTVAWAQTNEGLGIPKRNEQQIEAQKLSKVPKQTKFVEAEYPKEAAEKGIEAETILLLDINAQGKVDSVSVAEPATPAGMGFDEAAMVAAQQFEFEPAELDGKPIAVQLSYRYKFKLKPKQPDAPGAPGLPPPAPGGVGAALPENTPPREPVLNFTGLLRERGTRLPMPGVLVTVFREVEGGPKGFEATTNTEGRFQFFDLEPGEWKVLIETPGYYPYRTTETIASNERVEVTYFVERGTYNPFDITITATRPRKEVSRTVLSAKEIEKIPGAAGDPLAVIQNFAGVARMPFAGQIIVRGSAPEDTQVFVDGATVPLIYHFGGLRSVIPVGMLDSIEFYPGNFSPEYGRATGGIIDVKVKKLQPPKIGGYVDVSLLDTGVFLEVPLGDKGAVAVAGRRSYIDWIITAAVPDDAPVNIITAPRYYDWQLLGNYRPAPAHELRAFFFGSDDRLKFLFQNPADIDTTFSGNSASFSTTFYRSLLTYKYVPGGSFENELRLASGRDWLDVKFGPLILDLNIYTAQIRENARNKLTEWLTLNYGLDVLFQQTDFLVQLPLPPKEGQPMSNVDLGVLRRSENNDERAFEPAFYAELELKPVPGLLLLPGLRLDRLQTDQWFPQPRLTARWEMVKGLTVKGGAGLFVQSPNPNEGEMDEVFGNPWLAAERAQHYSLGFEWKPREYLTLDWTGFYKRLRSLVSSTDDVINEDGVLRPLIYDNGGKGRVYGMELVARHEFANDFTGWIAYTLSRARRTDSGSTQERLFDFDQTHILTMIGSYLLPRNWQVGARFRLVSGNPRTPVTGAVYNASTDRYDPTYGAVNSARNGAFHQLDLRIDKRWIYQRWMFNAYLDIQNVYNRPNPEGTQYNYNFRLSKPQQGLPLLTILGLRAEF
jgi:TonB family protein